MQWRRIMWTCLVRWSSQSQFGFNYVLQPKYFTPPEILWESTWSPHIDKESCWSPPVILPLLIQSTPSPHPLQSPSLWSPHGVHMEEYMWTKLKILHVDSIRTPSGLGEESLSSLGGVLMESILNIWTPHVLLSPTIFLTSQINNPTYYFEQLSLLGWWLLRQLN